METKLTPDSDECPVCNAHVIGARDCGNGVFLPKRGKDHAAFCAYREPIYDEISLAVDAAADGMAEPYRSVLAAALEFGRANAEYSVAFSKWAHSFPAEFGTSEPHSLPGFKEVVSAAIQRNRVAEQKLKDMARTLYDGRTDCQTPRKTDQ